jgi:hypothetical protein
MKYKLDLHCHSIASDGALSIPQLAAIAKKVGLGALVLTDHGAYNAFHANETVLETLSLADFKLPLPVIVGSEIRTPYGEFLFFGRQANRQWIYYKHHLEFTHSKFGCSSYWKMFNEVVLHSDDLKSPLHYAMAICHPRDIDLKWCTNMPECFWNMVHGFEIQNSYEYYDEAKPDVITYFKEHIPRYKALRNSDCHADELGLVSNTDFNYN